ncbi:hypothetical protein EV191_12742, partial [Tamaricihabitans halophyticus]
EPYDRQYPISHAPSLLGGQGDQSLNKINLRGQGDQSLNKINLRGTR